ncbi:hypothetical protein [Haloarcula sp. Atlit-7R]|uniref:hypothetical protein n=1 Tax=Haloarcula sp. Atlit-7R TaxID=2282125 RepID=UPI0013145AA8|nr:hypothetical protein [Haloarcula sp. Atlit-7R]
MRHTGQPPLPDWIQSAYQTLERAYATGTDELSKSEAHEFLLAESEDIEEQADAVYVVDRLLDRGWLYEVDDQLRKTE